MCSKLYAGAMKSLDDTIDSRSWSLRQDAKREYILKHSNQEILTRPIPLTLLHKTLKVMYGMSTSHKNRLYQELSKRKRTNKRLKCRFKHIKMQYCKEENVFEDAGKALRDKENEQRIFQEGTILKAKSETLNSIKFYEQNYHTKSIFSLKTQYKDNSTNTVHRKYISSMSKKISSKKRPNKLAMFEKPSTEKITEIFLKKERQSEPKEVKPNTSDTIDRPQQDEEEEIFLDAITFSPSENENLNPDDNQQTPPTVGNADSLTQVNEFDDGGGQPPDDSNTDGGEGDSKKTPSFLAKTVKRCVTCEIYLLRCCQCQSKLDNLFCYSSALERRCEDYEKIIQMYCTRIAASQIIIKHFKEKNNQLLQKWEAIQGGTKLKVTKKNVKNV